MLLFAHLGLTMAAAQLARKALKPSMAFVALGSMLPDLVDKPLGWIVFGTPAMGRIYAHTILFLLVLLAISALTRSNQLASMSGGVTTHLVLDTMWNSPVTLLWPLLGNFPDRTGTGVEGYLEMLIHGLSNPMISVPEALGLIYLIYYVLRVDPGVLIKARALFRRGMQRTRATIPFLQRGRA